MRRFHQEPGRSRSVRTRRAESAFEKLEGRTLFATFLVTSSEDEGPGTLRQAITLANNEPGRDVIAFNLPAGEMIQPLHPLPDITDAVALDGTTQPGFAGRPLVRLDGSQIPFSDSGLTLLASDSSVEGLIVTRFGGAGVTVWGSRNTLSGNYIGTEGTPGPDLRGNMIGVSLGGEGNDVGGTRGNVISGNFGPGILSHGNGTNWIVRNFIGTDATGTAAVPNRVGIEVHGFAATYVGVGASGATGRNVVSGNQFNGIEVHGAPATITGNYIGLDATGRNPLGNGNHGLFVRNVGPNSGVIIGVHGTEANVISANAGSGVHLANSSAVWLRGNLIGTDATGESVHSPVGQPLGNAGHGVELVQGSGLNRIGFDIEGDGNVIAGNAGHGIRMWNAGWGNEVLGNFIGTNSWRAASLGNGGDGVNLESTSGTRIGGGINREGNFIHNNAGNGVKVFEFGEGNNVWGNSIARNGRLGIDLGAAFDPAVGSVTLNDPQDADWGPNRFQNHPLITSAVREFGNLTIAGSLDAEPNTHYRIDLFSSDPAAVDPTGHGEGLTYLRSLTGLSDASGVLNFFEWIPSLDIGQHWITATATDVAGNTSEFSPAFLATVGPREAREAMFTVQQSEPLYHGQRATFDVRARAFDGSGIVPTGTLNFWLANRFDPSAPRTLLGTRLLDPAGPGESFASFTTAPMARGMYDVEIQYSGSPDHFARTFSNWLNVQPDATETTLSAAPNPVVRGEELVLTATVLAQHSDGTPTGLVNFLAMGQYGQFLGTAELVDGVARLSVTSLRAGNYEIAAEYVGDPSLPFDLRPYQGSYSVHSFQRVDPAPSTVTVGAPANVVRFGEPVILGAQVTSPADPAPSPDPGPDAILATGEITFRVGDRVLGTTYVNNGFASIHLSDNPLTPGEHLVTAAYAGDEQHQPAESAPFTLTIQPVESMTNLMPPPVQPAYGQPVQLRVTVGPQFYNPAFPQATGTVTFRASETLLGQATLVNGEAVLDVVLSDVGQALVSAEYAGDAIYAPSIGGAAIQVLADSTTTTLASSHAAVRRGETFVLSAAVRGDHGAVPTTGVVEFLAIGLADGRFHAWGAPLADGAASVTVSDLPAGDYDVVANYRLDPNIPWDRQRFLESQSNRLAQRVDPALTRVTVGAPATTIPYGQPVVLGAQIRSSANDYADPDPSGWDGPTGEVVFRAGDVVLGTALAWQGLAAIHLEGASVLPGEYAVTATYAGDSQHAGAVSEPFTITILPVASMTSLFVEPFDPRFGQMATLRGSVQADPANNPFPAPATLPTGTVTLRIGQTVLGQATVVDGQFSIQTAALPVGQVMVEARYSGDAIYLPGVGGAIFDVSPASTTTSLATSPSPSVYGESVRLVATVAEAVEGAAATGWVEFRDLGGAVLGRGAVDGQGRAAIDVTPAAAGVYDYTAHYEGDGNFTASASAPLAHGVQTAQTATQLASSANPAVADQPVTLTATMSVAGRGAGVPVGDVTFMRGDVALGTAMLVDGVATYTTSDLPVGQHPITAVYHGSENFDGSTSEAVSQSVNYPTGTTVARNQTATVVFWNGSKGQALIRKFDGSSTATELGNWLAGNYPRLFGAQAVTGHDLTGRTNGAVADYYRAVHSSGNGSLRIRAQVLALALNVYATTDSLGGPEAAAYGFAVSRWGVLIATWNVGGNGEPFGVSDNSVRPVHLLLAEADARCVNGQLFGGSASLQSQANTVLEAINRAGGI